MRDERSRLKLQTLFKPCSHIFNLKICFIIQNTNNHPFIIIILYSWAYCINLISSFKFTVVVASDVLCLDVLFKSILPPYECLSISFIPKYLLSGHLQIQRCVYFTPCTLTSNPIQINFYRHEILNFDENIILCFSLIIVFKRNFPFYYNAPAKKAVFRHPVNSFILLFRA